MSTGMNFRGLFYVVKRYTAMALTASLLFDVMGVTLLSMLLTIPATTEAAARVLEPTPNTSAIGHTLAGSSIVFINENVGYKFHRFGVAPNSGMCVYRKTMDGGLTWGAQVAVDTQTDCINVVVWYDQWTPGDTGDYIHIATFDTSDDILFYNRLDTTDDSLLLATATSTTPGAPVTYAAGTNVVSITKATDGTLYMVADDAQGSRIVSCSASCDLSTSWSNVGTPPQGNADSWSLLMPLPAAEILLINRSIGNVLRSSIWDGVSWSTFVTIDASAIRNTTYDVGMSATVSTTTGDIHLAYVADNNDFVTDNHDIRTATFSSGSWTTKTDILTNTAGRGLTQLAVGYDQSNDDIYVAYAARETITAAASANIYYVRSSDDMSTWSSEAGPINTTPGDFYGVNLNIMSPSRLYVTWFDNVTGSQDIFGEVVMPEPLPGTVVTLDPTPNTTGATHTVSGSDIVFLDDQVGYKFHRFGVAPHSGMCVYRKTTDGGLTWSTQVPVDSQTDCSGISVWYDQWTPGDNGTYIHIATYDIGDDQLFYNRLNTTDDSLLLTTATSTTLGSPSVLAVGTNIVNITKATDGKIYMVLDDAQGTMLVSCNSACDVSTNWVTVGLPPQGNADSWSMLMPLSAGNVILINRSTLNQLRSSIWNGSTWSSFSTIDAAAIRNTTYDVGMAATVDLATGDIYLVYTADNDTYTVADHDIKTAIFNGSSWSAATAIVTDDPVRALLQVAIGRDQNNGDIYVGYTARAAIADANSVNVHFIRSTDNMTTWGSEQGPVNNNSGNFYGISMNPMSFERLYVSWFDAVTTVLDVFGATLANIGPDTKVSGVGTPELEVRSDVNNFYVGGAFLLESLSERTVNTIRVTESGTINAQNNIKNVKLFYDFDTSAPYDCSSESYSGGESQFGTTVAGGFSGSDGLVSFSTSPVSFGPTNSMCLYVVFDIKETATDGETIKLSIADPVNDILVSGGVDVFPATAVFMTGTTTIVESNLIQNGYHWRLDNGSEVSASSATLGAENTALTALTRGVSRRLRLAVTNEGSTSTLPSTYRLEYGTAVPTCADTSSWTEVGISGAIWEMSPSANLIDGDDTTDILPANGGVTESGTYFISPNGGVRDQNNTSDSLVLDIDDYTEFEFSLIASSTAIEGETYCFRLARNGQALTQYSNFPRATIAADVLVQSFGNQIATVAVLDNNVYAGGGFSLMENSSSRDVTSITLSETGTIAAATSIENLRLYYESDTSAPFDCSSETYNGTEAQFGSTISNGFSGLGETALFNDVVTISTTSTLCLYVLYDVTGTAQNGDTIEIAITSPSTNIAVTGLASVGPSGQVSIPGTTGVLGAILTQQNYHWRNDDGNESGATSATNGNQNTTITDFTLETPIRLRLGITNTGVVTSVPDKFILEYAPKITTCDMATVWTDLDDASDGWDMYDSIYLTHGEPSTNISEGSGGVGNGAGSFIAVNEGVSDTSSFTGTTTIPSDDYLDLEFSFTSTDLTSYNTTYCFRVKTQMGPLGAYSQYAELTTAPKRDFKIQRGSTQVSGTSTLIIAGSDYDAPDDTNYAFVRITNSHYTGSGHDTGSATAQNVDDVTAYIQNPDNLATSFILSRPTSTIASTRVDWEIIEFIGNPGTDNEMFVRDANTVLFSTSALVATGTPLLNVSNDSKVVVFITGVRNSNTSRNYYAGQVTAAWDSVTKSPVFTRGANGASLVNVSYAVVEYVGANWKVQRVQHGYNAVGVIETENIAAVNNISRTFLHVQKRMGANTNVVNFGHEVWLSSIGAISFRLESGATVAIEQTSVAWVIENMQTGQGAMKVQQSDGLTSGGTAPLAVSVILPVAIAATNNTSIMANTRGAGANTTFPRGMAGFTITSTTTYQVWRSNTGSALVYRVELVEWPVADLSIRQNYHIFYVDNNLLTPTDPWPPGPTNMGENATLTTADEPLAIGERLRVRTTLRTSNANMPAGFQDFKLQYALRVSTCGAISGGGWTDVGAAGSGAIWRGYNATGTVNGAALSTNPPTPGDLLIISVADRAGALVHQNPSPVNPYPVIEGEDIEYDWYLEQNGANPQSTYCFRTVRTDGSILEGYNNYPQIRTAGFTPVSKNWRWYEDTNNETPVSPLAIENVAPIDIVNNSIITLRVNVDELKNASGENIKFKLQFSEDVNFSNAVDVSATSTCQDRSLWCYAEGGGVDNQYITTAILSESDTCVAGVGAGCGRHNTRPNSATTHTHFGFATQEYNFYVKHVAARVNAVYYFRLYDVTNDVPVFFANGYSYPSVVTEGPRLQFSLAGLPAGTSTAGIVTDISTTPTGMAFGSLLLDTEYKAAHRITVETNATEGYQLFKFAKNQLISAGGVEIPSVAATNLLPDSWSDACNSLATGCFGYHSTDPTLSNGSTRFAATDTYAGLETSPVEVMYSSIPSIDTHDIVYRIIINEMQAAGIYETEIVYLAVPSY